MHNRSKRYVFAFGGRKFYADKYEAIPEYVGVFRFVDSASGDEETDRADFWHFMEVGRMMRPPYLPRTLGPAVFFLMRPIELQPARRITVWSINDEEP